MKPQWAGPEHCGSFEATLGSLKAASLGSAYVYGALSTRGMGYTPRHTNSECAGAESSPSPTLSWDLRNKGYLLLLCLPCAKPRPAWHMGEECRDTCLLHHTGLYLAAQPGQPGRW